MQEKLINRTLLELQDLLSGDQLKKLKDVLTVECANYLITEQKNEVVIYDEISDIAAYKQFFVSKKIQGLSSGTLNLYMQTINLFMRSVRKSVGSENLTKPDIRQYIDERLEQLQSEKIANQEEVLEYLSKVMRGEETDQTVVFQGSEYGSTIEDVQVANKDRIRAAELLGKRYSLWTDKVELDGNMDLKVVVDYGDGENEAPNDS